MGKYLSIAIILFLTYGVYDCSNRVKERQERKERSAQFFRTPAGQDFTAKVESIGGRTPIKSLTGNLFYRGMRCYDDCSGHIAGYEYAINYGLSNTSQCDESDSESFAEGCSKGVQDIIDEYEPVEDDRDYGERESRW
ncbi:hypothetical protein [Citrobacter amalonaticus]|uniref:hypothetical protein n=1 Tax=Citrobacter amalonaticus TaxID=35703 RepID=UPI000B199129|nr:hypothetical protein [Citrobacter amalonaticus]HED1256450.1 hypothetical protein [Citrobacter amalonaticus]